MATKGIANLIENPNKDTRKFAMELGAGLADAPNRIPGFLWICTKAEIGQYFVLPSDDPKSKASDESFLELKPDFISIKLDDEKKSWKVDRDLQTTKQIKECYEKILEISTTAKGKGFPGGKGKNSRLKIVGKAGVWNSGKYDRRITRFIDEVEKSGPLGGKAGGDPAKAAPSTVIQEQVTLAIFEILMRPTGYNSKGNYEAEFDKICTGFDGDGKPVTGGQLWYQSKYRLGKIWKGLASARDCPDYMRGIPGAKYDNKMLDPPGDNAKMRAWYYHFLLQFRDIEKDVFKGVLKKPYTKYTYDDFMNFITDLITSGPLAKSVNKSTITSKWPPQINKARTKKWKYLGAIGQKDSWNPADIWLVDTKSLLSPWQPGATDDYIQALKKANTVGGINKILNAAYHKDVIVGISLKKSVAGSSKKGFENKKLHFEKVNLTANLDSKKFPTLPDVKFSDWSLDLSWNSGSKEFVKITNELTVTEMSDPPKDRKKAKMRIGSGGQAKPHNINLEYAPVGGAAQLGKVPKNLLRTRISQPGMPRLLKVPSLEEALASIPDKKTDTPAQYNKKVTDMNKKVKAIRDFNVAVPGAQPAAKGFKSGNQTNLNNFVARVLQARTSPKWKEGSTYVNNISMNIQIMEWASILCTIRGKTKAGEQQLNNFIMDTYYYAQKKGSVLGTRFGPFGKLS